MSSNGKGLSSPIGKKIMGYAYGIGASVVIIGALFKILHLPGARIALTLGMGTEALLFFLGSFEPAHQEATRWDWSKIYPGLVPEKTDAEKAKEAKQLKKSGNTEEVAKVTPSKAAPVVTTTNTVVANSTPMVGMSEEESKQWNESIKKMLATVEGLGKMADSQKVSEEYINKIKEAGASIEELSKAQEAGAAIIANSTEKFGTALDTTSESIKQSLGEVSQKASETLEVATEKIANSYSEGASIINKAGGDLTNSYTKVTEALSKKADAIENASSDTEKSLESVSKNLTAINAVYELQLSALNEEVKIKEKQTETQNQVAEQLALLQKALSEAVNNSNTYKAESEKLSNSIAELNSVYGNMLGSLNS